MFKRREKKIKKEFEKIYDTHIEQVFRFVYLKVGSKDDAEDITSRVFLQTWKSVTKESPDKKSAPLENPRAFLYQVARNQVIDYYRKNRPKREEIEEKSAKPRRVPLEEATVVDKSLRADEKALLESEIESIKDALGKLNEDYQNVIIWYYLDELSIPEIADLLEKPEASVRVLIHRAVASLKKQLKK